MTVTNHGQRSQLAFPACTTFQTVVKECEDHLYNQHTDVLIKQMQAVSTWNESIQGLQPQLSEITTQMARPLLYWAVFPFWWWLFPRVQGFWENVQQFIPRLRFLFFKVEISLPTLIPLFRLGSVQSGSAS